MFSVESHIETPPGANRQNLHKGEADMAFIGLKSRKLEDGSGRKG
jgi:hypothetical protein